MLPARHRLRGAGDFASVVRGRGGARAGSPLLVVHARRSASREGCPPRVGFVVSRAVGGAVERNRTKRRLRAIMHTRVGGLPTGTDVVVRANPGAAQAAFAELRESLNTLCDRVVRRLEEDR